MTKILISIIAIISINLTSINISFAYRVPANSWYAGGGAGAGVWPRGSDGRYYRIYNSTGNEIFVPGRDDAGNENETNWSAITWSKNRPGSIRIHNVLWPGVGITNCPNANIGDSGINYWGTSLGWQSVGSSTTVLAYNDWTNRLYYGWSQSFNGEIRCDFGANFAY